MSYSEADYLKMATQEYDDPDKNNLNKPSYTTNLNGKKVTASTANAKITVNGKEVLAEHNGMQASVVDDHGQYTVVFRGSQSMGTTEGNKDWMTDAGLNNPEGYQDASSQFKDADAWIKQEQAAGKLPKDMGQVTFTGHSLGGGLAQYEAVKNSASAVSFSGPSPYNMLTPAERKKIGDANIINLRRADDAVPNMPPGVPRIGQQIYVEGKTGPWWQFLVGAGGHDYANNSYAMNSDGRLVRGNQFSESAINSLYNNFVPGPWLLGKIAPIAAGTEGFWNKGKSAINDIFHGHWGNLSGDVFGMVGSGVKAFGGVLDLGLDAIPGVAFTESGLKTIADLAINVLGGGSGAMVGKVMSIKDPIDRAAAELLLLHQNLDNIQQANNKIIPDMGNALSDVKTTVLDTLGWMGLTIGDIDDIVYETQSDVEHHVSREAISEVNQLVEKKKQEIQKVADGLKSTAANKLAHDQAWAAAFGG